MPSSNDPVDTTIPGNSDIDFMSNDEISTILNLRARGFAVAYLMPSEVLGTSMFKAIEEAMEDGGKEQLEPADERDVEVREDESEAGWLVIYSDASCRRFDTEGEACAYQRAHREHLGLDPVTGE